jgi:chorismate mutase
MTSIPEFRKKIEEIDLKLSKLLKKRFNYAKEIGNIKAEKALPVKQKDREEHLLKKVSEICGDDINCKHYLVSIFKKIYRESRRTQQNIKKDK